MHERMYQIDVQTLFHFGIEDCEPIAAFLLEFRRVRSNVDIFREGTRWGIDRNKSTTAARGTTSVLRLKGLTRHILRRKRLGVSVMDVHHGRRGS